MIDNSNLPPGVSASDPHITGQPDDEVDPLQIALAELASDVVPTPDDLLDNCGPLTCLYYLAQTAAFTAGRFAGTLDTDHDDDPDDDSEPVRALAAITLAMGALNNACTLVGIYPPDAALDAAQALGVEAT